MKVQKITLALLTLLLTLSLPVLAKGVNDEASPNRDCVILLHGLGRSSKSMRPIAKQLSEHGYRIANIDYPSRHQPISTLASKAIQKGISRCSNAPTIHFVTHSLGGILVREYLQENTIKNLGHVVMLGPPNQGSPVVDAYSNWPFAERIGGSAFLALSPTDGEVMDLGGVNFSLGVIAGKRTMNPILSSIIDGPDDGKVQVDDTRVQGMQDHRVIAVSHPMMMRNTKVQQHVVCYLASGHFCKA